MLYIHLQNELTEEDIAKIKDTKNYLLNDNKKLKTYVNETVLATEASLEREIILLEEYLFTGNMKPSELDEDTHERIALRSYLDALKNYHVSIDGVKNSLDWQTDRNDPLYARVEYIDFNIEGPNQFSGHGNLDTLIAISYNQENHSENRQEFLDLEPQFEGHSPVLGYHNESNIEYYYGPKAVNNRMQIEEDELKDDMRTMTGEYLGNELLGFGIGLARSGISIPASFASSFLQKEHEKNEMEEDLMWSNIKIPADEFSLEMKINDRASIETSNERQAELYPTDKTYDILNRWEAIHQEDANFPYDAEAIDNHDWNELYQLVYGETDNDEPIVLSEHDQQLYEYILDGTIPPEGNKNSTIEKIESKNEKR